MTVAGDITKAIPSAINALAEILALIGVLRAASGLPDAELQTMIDARIAENERKLLALLLR